MYVFRGIPDILLISYVFVHVIMFIVWLCCVVCSVCFGSYMSLSIDV